MRQDINRNMVRRIVSPPALPTEIPLTSTRGEHVAAHDVGANILDHLVEHFRIGVLLPATLALLPSPASGLEHPLVEPLATFADRILEALVRSGHKAVEGDRDPSVDLTHDWEDGRPGRESSPSRPRH